MKKMTLALLVSVFSLSASAATFITCDGITSSNRTLMLAIKDAQLLQVRVQTAGSHPRAFAVNSISEDDNNSFYSIAGSSDIVAIQNSVLLLDGGLVNIGAEKFVCEAK